jgi:hypothetical protein
VEHFSTFFPDLYSHQTNADIPLFQQFFLKSINLRPANFILPVRELFLIYLSWKHGNYPAACASKRRNYQAFTTTPNARFWNSADISALPHPGIIKLSFDIPYQLLLIPFSA